MPNMNAREQKSRELGQNRDIPFLTIFSSFFLFQYRPARPLSMARSDLRIWDQNRHLKTNFQNVVQKYIFRKFQKKILSDSFLHYAKY